MEFSALYKKQFFVLLLLLCSCGEVGDKQKKESNLEDTPTAVESSERLSLTLSQRTQQACAVDKVTLQHEHLGTLKNTVNSLITQAGTLQSEKPWNCAESLANDMQHHLQRQAMQLQAAQYDIVVIGAGVQASIFNAALWEKMGQQHRNVQVLFIDQNHDGGAQHFRTYIYEINTGATGTNFPPAPLQINEYTAEENPPAYSIWIQTVLSHFSSHSHFLFGKHVKTIEFLPNQASKYPYKVRFDDMSAVHAKTVIIATGLGDAKVPEESDRMWLAQQQQQAMTCKTLSCVPAVLTFEQMVMLERHLNARGLSLLKVLENKRVAILGKGASGQAAHRFLEGKAPSRAYQYASTHTRPNHIEQFSGGTNKIKRLGQTQASGVAVWDAGGNKHIFNTVIVAMGHERIGSNSRLQRLIAGMVNQARPNLQWSEPLAFVPIQNSENTPIAYQLKEKCQLTGNKVQCPLAASRGADEAETRTGSQSPFHSIFVIGVAAEGIGSGKSLGDVINTSAQKTTQFAHWLLLQLQ